MDLFCSIISQSRENHANNLPLFSGHGIATNGIATNAQNFAAVAKYSQYVVSLDSIKFYAEPSTLWGQWALAPWSKKYWTTQNFYL